ncbi:MAG: MFS transporter [Thermomicrobiales bacterium]
MVQRARNAASSKPSSPSLSPTPPTNDAIASSSATSTGRRAGFAELLQEPNLRRLWVSQLCSSAGESLSQIAMPLFVFSLTGSARMVGFMALVLILPRVLLSPITGLLADRLDRRNLMMTADAARLILVLLVPFSTAIWQLSILAVLLAVGNAVGRPAELAAVPSVAGKERLVAALSLVQVSNGVIRIAIPAAGAGIVAALGPGPVFWVQALCFIGSLLALRKLVIPRLSAVDVDRPFGTEGVVQAAKAEMWAGIRAVRQVPIVRGVTTSESLFQIAAAAMTVAGVIYTQETLHLGDRADSAFALMTTFMATGAVTGALLAHRVEARIGRPLMLALGYLGPFFLVSAAFSPAMPVIYAAWFCFGILDAMAVISFQAYLAEAVPEEERGRVYAAWGAIVSLAAALAFYGMGLLVPVVGAPAAFAMAGLTVGIGGPLSLWLTGAIRSVRQASAVPVSSSH